MSHHFICLLAATGWDIVRELLLRILLELSHILRELLQRVLQVLLLGRFEPAEVLIR